jgi:hypothetical protein
MTNVPVTFPNRAEESSSPCGAAVTHEKNEKLDANSMARARPTTDRLAGTLWFAGWLFTIAFARLVWWKAILGLVVWPYFLALALR